MSQTKAQLISDLVQSLNFSGTSAAPANGMYLSAANTIKLATNTTPRLTIDSSGNATFTGTVVANAFTGNASSATSATTTVNVNLTDESSDATCYPIFATADTGTLPPKTGTNLTFNSSTGALSATTFSGSGANLTNLPDNDQIKEGNSYAEILDTGNNGIFRFLPEGTEVFRIDKDGKVGIGTNNAGTNLHIQNTSANPQVRISSANDGICELQFGDQADTVRGNIIYRNGSAGDALCFNGYNNTERMRIDSGGRILIGATASQEVYGSNKFQIQGTSSTTSGMSLLRQGGSPYLALGATGGSSLGSVTAVSSGDRLGQVTFCGADGTDVNTHAASVAAYADGNVSSNTVPGRLVFSTSSGAGEPERMRINSSGQVFVGCTDQLSAYASDRTKLSIWHSGDSGGYLELGGNQTAANYSAGTILFCNTNNSSSVKDIAMMRAEVVTSDNNAGDDSGGNICFYNRAEGGGPLVNFKVRSDRNCELVDGNLIVADGHGIDFSATSDAGGKTSELLDDYEEGTWTPVLNGSSGSASWGYGATGKYTKIGREVTAHFSMQSYSGNLGGVNTITGWPFTNGYRQYGSDFGLYNFNTPSNTVGKFIYFDAGVTLVYVYYELDDAQSAPLDSGYLKSGSYIEGNFHYIAA